MKKNASELLWKWYRRSLVAQIAHYTCASLYARLHYCLGFPSIILTTVVGSSIFASINTDSESNAYKWGFGVLSIVAASLGAAQTFLRFAERAEAHRIAGVRYSALKREIEHFTVFVPEDLDATISSIRAEWDKLTNDCEIIPEHIFRAAERRVYKGEGITIYGKPIPGQHPLTPGPAGPETPPHPHKG